MDGIVQNETTKTEGGAIETAQPAAAVDNQATVTAPATENPTVAEQTPAKSEQGEQENEVPASEQPSDEPAREMNAEQFDMYNETLRRVSKTAKAGLETRYNAFEDAEVKAAVKKAIMAGETPDIKAIASSVIERHMQPPAPAPATATENIESTTDTSKELQSLKVENALLKAGIKTDRLEAATKLFIAEGADPKAAAEWVKKYPEWGNQEGGVTFTQAPPVAGKTAPTPNAQPPLSDFDKKVQAARKARGLDT